ncbi:Digestive organ expansion factor, partial [Sesamum angolense]
ELSEQVGDSELEEAGKLSYREPTMYDDLLKKLGSQCICCKCFEEKVKRNSLVQEICMSLLFFGQREGFGKLVSVFSEFELLLSLFSDGWQREEQGESDSDEDEDGDSDAESLSESEEEDDGENEESQLFVSIMNLNTELDLKLLRPFLSLLLEETRHVNSPIVKSVLSRNSTFGNVNKSPRSYAVGNGPKTGAEQSEHVESDNDEEELSDTDEESDSRVNGQPSVIISTFHNHLSHKLASEEVDNIMKRKWKYTWKMPALNMSNCSWRGTGACFIKDSDMDSNYGLKPRLYKHWLESYKASAGSEFHQSKQRLFFLYLLLPLAMAHVTYGELEVVTDSLNCLITTQQYCFIVSENVLLVRISLILLLFIFLTIVLLVRGLGEEESSFGRLKNSFDDPCICNSYYDIMHHNKKPFYLKGTEEDSSIMDSYLMHSLNHIFRSRDLIGKNERKLAKEQKSGEGISVEGDAYLDRGFTRPKVLILLPLAGVARRVVKRLIQLTPSKHKANVENLERFYEEFGSGRTESRDEDDDSEIPKPKKSAKPPDFQALLGRDNDNDHFVIGVKFTNKAIKLYGDFYTSDMIVASPLGLITKIGEAEVEKDKDVDYLSSIEVLIIDHSDIMLMQNWSHVNTVVEQLNRLPSKQHGTDIMRIRPWYLDGQARFYRQTIILEINALFNQHCLNYRGKYPSCDTQYLVDHIWSLPYWLLTSMGNGNPLKEPFKAKVGKLVPHVNGLCYIDNTYPCANKVKLECKYKGVLPKILIQARQIYERFDTESIAEADDARLNYFCEKVFPKIKDSIQNGVMIFISSYFEFVRVRNYLKSQAASFCLFGEYIKRNDISHVRGQFFRGEKKIMLYTERAHFYYRYKIRGVKNLIIYSLPERKEFYPEIVNLLEESDSMNCTVLFSRLDHLRLERIVGSTAAKRMVDSEKGVFVFA